MLLYSGNQPSLSEKFGIVYESAEQSEQWFSDTVLAKKFDRFSSSKHDCKVVPVLQIASHLLPST